MTLRQYIETEFTAAIAEIRAADPAIPEIRVIATEREIDGPERLTLLIRQKRVAKSAQLPMSHRDVDFLVTFISPRADLDRAMDDLEAVTIPFLDWLDKKYLHDAAETVNYLSFLSIDIPFTFTAKKEG